MSVLAVTAGIAAAKMIAGAIGQHRAKKKGEKAEKEINETAVAQGKELQKGVDSQVQAERDLANEYAGQTSISPETQYARNQSERATSSAIDKAVRTGGSSTEIMNMVSALSSKGQNQAQKISAAEAERRKAASVASKSHALRAAQAGLAGKQMQIGLQDKAYQKTLQKQSQINQAVSQNVNYYADALGDIGSAYLYSDIYGSGASGGGVGGKELAVSKVVNSVGKRKKAGGVVNNEDWAD